MRRYHDASAHFVRRRSSDVLLDGVMRWRRDAEVRCSDVIRYIAGVRRRPTNKYGGSKIQNPMCERVHDEVVVCRASDERLYETVSAVQLSTS